jgi:hypothetical protein
MRTTQLSIPEIGLIAITRGMLGAGIALLNARKLSEEQQRAIGITLTLVGVITTVPLLMEVFKCGNGRCGRDY